MTACTIKHLPAITAIDLDFEAYASRHLLQISPCNLPSLAKVYVFIVGMGLMILDDTLVQIIPHLHKVIQLYAALKL